MLNGSPLSHSGTTHSKSLDVGSLVKVAVKLTNNSMADIPVSFLVLEPYTFSQEGRSIVRNLAGKMLHGGNLVTSVPKVSVEEGEGGRRGGGRGGEGRGGEGEGGEGGRRGGGGGEKGEGHSIVRNLTGKMLYGGNLVRWECVCEGDTLFNSLQ